MIGNVVHFYLTLSTIHIEKIVGNILQFNLTLSTIAHVNKY